MLSLAETFRAAVSMEIDAGDELTATLAEAMRVAHAAWTSLAVDDDVFVRHLARHYTAGVVIGEWLARVRVGELYLACACIHDIPGAADAFEREYIPLVEIYLRRAGTPHDLLDEVRQQVREKLLVGARKIGEYSGRGTLAKWLEVVTLRIVIDLARAPRDVIVDDLSDLDVVGFTDPEIDHIKERYRAPFNQALRDAVRTLDAEQRNLLRLHFVDRMTLDQLAKLFAVHRATVVRRVAAAREQILTTTKRLLQEELNISREEVDSLLGLMRSRLDISLSVLLGRST